MKHNLTPKQAAMKKALAILSEHFENVQIFCNCSDAAGTIDHWESGKGNILANITHCELWLEDVHDSLMASRQSEEEEEETSDTEDSEDSK